MYTCTNYLNTIPQVPGNDGAKAPNHLHDILFNTVQTAFAKNKAWYYDPYFAYPHAQIFCTPCLFWQYEQTPRVTTLCKVWISIRPCNDYNETFDASSLQHTQQCAFEPFVHKIEFPLPSTTVALFQNFSC
jgi:hypothetical protein